MSNLIGELALLVLLALAAGVSLPLFLLLPALLVVLPWIPAPGGGMALLASPIPALLGGMLLGVSLLLHRVPGLGGLWAGVLSVAALSTALLLPHLVLPAGETMGTVTAATLLSLFLVVYMQAIGRGRALLRWWDPPTRGSARRILDAGFGTGLVAFLLLGALVAPVRFLVPALLLAGGIVLLSGSAVRAVAFLPRLGRGVLRHLEGRSDVSSLEPPRWAGGEAVRDGENAGGDVRGVRAGLLSETGAIESRTTPGLVGRLRSLLPTGTPDFRSGWLIQRVGHPPTFRFRGPVRDWEIDLDSAVAGESETTPWGFRIPLTLNAARFLLLVPRDAPDPAGRIQPYHFPGTSFSFRGPSQDHSRDFDTDSPL